MNDHDESFIASASLCDTLFQELSKRIDDLQREKRQRWCCLFQLGHKRFAYVSHRKKSARLEIWFIGEVSASEQYPDLEIKWRTPTSGGFGQAFKARFYLDHLSQVQNAVDLLYHVSYSASKKHDTRLEKRNFSQSITNKEDIAPYTVKEARYVEGEKRAAVITVRSPTLRAAAKRKWGLKCYCCGFDFEQFYGDIAKDFAIVHHLDPFMDASNTSRESTLQDVRVVCANCHYVLHLETPPIDVDNLKKQISCSWDRWSEFGIQRKNKEY